jgi:hydroxyethylthiazole kinase-like sugar kinase family protein
MNKINLFPKMNDDASLILANHLVIINILPIKSIIPTHLDEMVKISFSLTVLNLNTLTKMW